MDKDTNKIINRYIAEVRRQFPELVKSYLFGSYARNNEKPESDIDIAFVIEGLKDEEKFDLQVKLLLLASHFDTRIEPHPIAKDDFPLGNPFAIEIGKTGVELKVNY